MMATNAARTGENPATTGGVDWGLNMFNNMYSFNGQVALSRTGQDARKTGIGTDTGFQNGVATISAATSGMKGSARTLRSTALGF
jgi:hypothetical protein